MGVFGFVAAGGGTLGMLLGGVLTDLLDWHWIFLVNVPIGVAVSCLAPPVLPADRVSRSGGRLDAGGAVIVTAGLMLAVYAIVNGNQTGWLSGQTLGLLTGSAGLLVAFLVVESRVRSPLMPLGLFARRNLATANVVGILWAAAMFAWFFLSALYLQLVLGYSPLQVGLAFLPANLIMAALSLGLSAKLVMRFGIKPPLVVGLTLAGVGLALLARAPVHGHYVANLLPSMVLLGFGAGAAFNPLLLAAMGDVEPTEAGLASGKHVVHDGWRARARGARERRRFAHEPPPRRRRDPHERARWRVPRRLRHRRRVRDTRCGRERSDASPAGNRGRHRSRERGFLPRTGLRQREPVAGNR